MTYGTFEDLKEAFDAGDVPPDEFRRYFSRLTGERFDGYPDFSSRYMEAFLPSGRSSGGRAKRRPRWVVVRSSCDQYANVIRIEGAMVFGTLKGALGRLSDLASSGGSTRIGPRDLLVRGSQGCELYKVVKESVE